MASCLGKSSLLFFAAAVGAAASDSDTVDVVIVGAGFAGLVAGRDMARGGLSVRVIEASERLGGRSHDKALPTGEVVENGVQFIDDRKGNPAAHRLFFDELNLTLFNASSAGDHFRNATLSYLCRNEEDHIKNYSTLWPGILQCCSDGPLCAAEAAYYLPDLMAIARTVDVDAPWTHPKAAFYDSISLDGWLRTRGMSESARIL